jgi:hypothetical protein
MIADEKLLSLTQILRLRASESSRRTVETRPGVNMVLQDNRLRPDTLTLQQRVELPVWHPEGMRGLSGTEQHQVERLSTIEDDEDGVEVIADDPHPEDWLPRVMEEVCQDILGGLEALDAAVPFHAPDNVEH